MSSTLLYISIALLPSVIWLIFYLREDGHPEPNKTIIKIFLMGMLGAPLVVIFEYLYNYSLGFRGTDGLDGGYLPLFLGIAFIEEYYKYLVVRFGVLKKKEFDEPVDAMEYLIIAALGFAALENIFYIFPIFAESFSSGAQLTILRFLGATFLHTLASGIAGFFLAMNIFAKKPRFYFYFGLVCATLFHSFFNYFIIKEAGPLFVVALLLSMFFIVLWMFQILKKIGSPRG